MARRAAGALALVCVLLAGAVLAAPPETSPLPPPRPGAAAAPESAAPAPQAPAPQASAAAPAPAAPLPGQPRPKPRPAGLAPAAAPAQAAPAPDPSAQAGLTRSPRPPPRPAGAAPAAQSAEAVPAASTPRGPKPGTRGALCGDSAITGQVLPKITSRTKGCGLAEPVSVEFVAGVRLNPPATIDCATAEALKTWVKKGLQPAFAPAKVVELRIFGSYMCRSRNNVRGARISEHGRGKAVDIGAFVLDSGKVLTVLDNYNKQIRRAQGAACGIFGTTLGPGSDGYHENHLHFDTASYRNGPYCH